MTKEEYKAEVSRMANEQYPKDATKAVKFIKGALYVWPLIESLQKEVENRDLVIKERISITDKQAVQFRKIYALLGVDLSFFVKEEPSDLLKKTLDEKDQRIADLEKEVNYYKEVQSLFEDSLRLIKEKDQRIKELEAALRDIENWDDDLEDKYEDPGYRAKIALNP